MKRTISIQRGGFEKAVNYKGVAGKILNEYNYFTEEDEELGDDFDDMGDMDGEDIDAELGLEDEPMEGGAETEQVEVEVTDLVSKQEELVAKFEEIIGAINTLAGNQSQIKSAIKSDIEEMRDEFDASVRDLQGEFKKRMPSADEKARNRAMDSYPYSTALSDFFYPATKEERVRRNQQGSQNDEDENNKEYVLTQADVDKNYNEYEISKSF